MNASLQGKHMREQTPDKSRTNAEQMLDKCFWIGKHYENKSHTKAEQKTLNDFGDCRYCKCLMSRGGPRLIFLFENSENLTHRDPPPPSRSRPPLADFKEIHTRPRAGGGQVFLRF